MNSKIINEKKSIKITKNNLEIIGFLKGGTDITVEYWDSFGDGWNGN